MVDLHTKTSNYMPQLDGLRALAVMAVMATHWLPERLSFGLPTETGVQLFFVLSGFLITGILLDTQQEDRPSDRMRVIRNFYVRRFLRIFPLYYLVLSAAYLFNIASIRETVGWHVAYLSNFCYYFHPGFGTEIGHFWSLAVEEQFYLFWPLVVVLLPRNRLCWAILLLGLCGPVYRMAGAFLSPIGHFYIGTPGSFDSLAMGAGLALGIRMSSRLFEFAVRFRWWLALAAALLFVFVRYGPVGDVVKQTSSLLLISILYAVLVFEASRGFGGIAGRILQFAALRYIGKISYGLYVLHNFASIPTKSLLEVMPVLRKIPANILILNVIITFVAAALCWSLFESRLNALKRYFPYRKPAEKSDFRKTQRQVPNAEET